MEHLESVRQDLVSMNLVGTIVIMVMGESMDATIKELVCNRLSSSTDVFREVIADAYDDSLVEQYIHEITKAFNNGEEFLKL